MSDTTNTSKTLKGRNLGWLVATLVLDVLALLVLAFDAAIKDVALTTAATLRASLTVLLPVPALVLSSLLSADFKAILVFWRLKDPLPGSRAFSKYAAADPRIDLTKLKKHVGEFPADAREQNAKWYGLYKQVASDPGVSDSHKNYLLFRDIAAMSLLLVPVVPIVMFAIDADVRRMLSSTAWFFGQYVVAALAARNTGKRFVQNVLAVHATKKVAAVRTAKA